MNPDILKSEAEKLIERSGKTNFAATASDIEIVNLVLTKLDCGLLRVASADIQKEGSLLPRTWTTESWLKEIILLFFRMQKITSEKIGSLSFVDKIPLKKWTTESQVRVVPPATARFGSYVAPNCVLMPSFINIGAYVDSGTMVDTWATVGSCAQIGKNVHLSGGVGIGGVLEPAQALPVIIEDHVFVGSRCVIVEGVIVREGAVIGAGTILTGSTPIIDIRGPSPVTIKGEVPANTIIIPGTRSKKFPAGEYQVPCALIIGDRTLEHDRKVSLNAALRKLENTLELNPNG